MGLDLKKRKETQKATTTPLAIAIGDDVLNIRYRPSVLTAGAIRRMKESMDKATETDASLSVVETAKRGIEFLQEKQQALLDMVAEWDLVSDGVPVPLTMEGLEENEVDHALIDLITEAIQGDQNPTPPTGRN